MMKKLNLLVLGMMLFSLFGGASFAQDAEIVALPEPRIMLEENFDEMYDGSYDADSYSLSEDELAQPIYGDPGALGDDEVMPISFDYDDMWQGYEDVNYAEMYPESSFSFFFPSRGELRALYLQAMVLSLNIVIIFLPIVLLFVFWLVMLIDAVAHQKKNRKLWIWLLALLRLIPVAAEIVTIVYYFVAKRLRNKSSK